ncbi:MAG TPA: hypothetical protein VK939_04370 [Longimicrobiales bacterium]|nr:hypothetical protein [Longimicrobiales bacterium]
MLVAIFGAAEVGAQQPAEQYWRELQRAASASEARSLTPPSALDGHVARGMLHGRLYELTRDRSEAYRGRRLLERATARLRDDAGAHFALGVLLARGPDARQRPFADADAMFVDPYSLAYAGALRALERALDLEPRLEAAAEELIRLGLDSHDPALARQGALRLAGRDTTGEQHLLLASAARLQDDASAAAHHARRAADHGGDGSVAAHAEAAALLQVSGRERAAAAVYFAGTAALTEAGAAAYWAGIAMIADEPEAAEWERTPGAERGAWIRRFWALRAGRAGVPEWERLAEHFRRVQTAHARYRLKAGLGAGGAMDRVELGVDAREFGMTLPGLMLVRHGDAHRLRALSACSRGIPYYLPRARADAADPPDAFVPYSDRMAARMESLGMPSELRLSCRPEAPGVTRAQLRRVGRMLIASDGYAPAVDTRLSFSAGLYAFRGAGGAVDVVAALAVPAEALRALADGSDAIAADLSLVLIDERARTVERADLRLQRGLPDAVRLPGGPPLLSLLQVELATGLEGSVAFRVMLRDTTLTRAGGWLGGHWQVPALTSGPGPQLSDLMLAPVDATGTWRRGEVALSPAPGKAFRTGEDLYLFYELYDVAEDVPYRTEILLAPQGSGLWNRARRLLAGSRDVVHVQFSERARAPHPRYGLQELRTLGTAELAAGSYRVEVRVMNETTGATAVRTRVIELAAPGT